MSTILQYPIAGTIVAGSLSDTTLKFVSSVLKMVAVKTTSTDITYTLTITDPASYIIYQRTAETGSFAEEVSLPMRGVYTVAISSASKNEAISIQLAIKE